MDDNLRRLADPSNTAGTLLTLPISDFPNASTATATATTASTDTKNNQENNNNETTQYYDDNDGLILISLPSNDAGNNGGRLTMDDLIRGESVYILGDTSETDLHTNTSIPAAGAKEANGGVSGSIEPIPARLIVEGKTLSNGTRIGMGKTMELTRVETSNTYIVVPPMPTKNDRDDGEEEGSNKRLKLLDASSNNNKDGKQDGKQQKALVTMPARSVGQVPGEESPATFFLDPLHLQPGHFGSKLRSTLSSWMYDPFDPPCPPVAESTQEGGEEEKEGGVRFGYTIAELAHVCRTSTSEMEYAIHNRVYGAEDALAISSAAASDTRRYGMLSEEGRQTVTMAIVAALLESDLDLICKSSSTPSEEGMELALLTEEIRSHWHREEGNVDRTTTASRQVHNPYKIQPHLSDSRSPTQIESESQFGTPSQFPTQNNDTQQLLADEVIWHCLRPILHYNAEGDSTYKDEMPEKAQLLPDQVAKLAAHHVFLRGTPRSSSSASSSKGAKGIGGGSAVWWEESELMEAWSLRLPSMSRYEPRLELLQGIAISKPKELVSAGVDQEEDAKDGIIQWQYFPEAALPLTPSQRIKSMFAMRNVWTLEEVVPYLKKFIVNSQEGDGKEGLHSMVAHLIGGYAKAISVTEKGGDGKDVTVVKYVVLPN
mmetsp:Transcript_31083/g.65582  ORF Transcript_31083/g.65582 Transcript_31083/m.65582 type:complete len:658 (-) Transcript_31083:124-2097(-)|eukprot:CAMPEP_0172316866 /NCGR_PEP_ID=MMETSP1058-20130122/29792_1 /TAXON_ID=83371 /ORGANISM="Detonula confervacea, Strain CCMP 353" /LENGTH=657 /DNA_ID=CAMNT_0013031293 /DNA_START=31 /DNA_END=2004 /DNA_ORIENTATION=-